jgi:hypothetical protein
MKACIITIGYTKYLMPNDTQGAAAIKALSKAIRVRSHYLSGVGEIFTTEPVKEHASLSLELVDKTKVRLNQKQLPERTEAA